MKRGRVAQQRINLRYVGRQQSPERRRRFRAGRKIAARPNIKAYLESDRRIPFNEDGIFRCYKELDG